MKNSRPPPKQNINPGKTAARKLTASKPDQGNKLQPRAPDLPAAAADHREADPHRTAGRITINNNDIHIMRKGK